MKRGVMSVRPKMPLEEMQHRPRPKSSRQRSATVAKTTKFMGGVTFQRARHQFQALYLLVGTFKGTNQLADELILWPNVKNADGTDHRPANDVRLAWCELVDDGRELPPESILKAIKQRFESFTETNIRLAINANAKASKSLADRLTKGDLLTDGERMALTTVNNGTGFMFGNVFNKKMPAEEKPKKIGKTKVTAAKRRDNVVEGKFGQSAS